MIGIHLQVSLKSSISCYHKGYVISGALDDKTRSCRVWGILDCNCPGMFPCVAHGVPMLVRCTFSKK